MKAALRSSSLFTSGGASIRLELSGTALVRLLPLEQQMEEVRIFLRPFEFPDLLLSFPPPWEQAGRGNCRNTRRGSGGEAISSWKEMARFPSSSYFTITRPSGSGSGALPFCLRLPGGLFFLCQALAKNRFGLLGKRASGVAIDESGQGLPGLLSLIQFNITLPQKKKGPIFLPPFRDISPAVPQTARRLPEISHEGNRNARYEIHGRPAAFYRSRLCPLPFP